MLLNIIVFLIIFSILVLVHELGHFWAAKKSGVKVEEFGIGLPPKLKTLWKDKSGVEYTLNAIPFGGFVRMLGQDDFDVAAADKVSHDQRSFENQSLGKKMFIIVAGVLMNAALAWALITVAFAVGFRPLFVLPDGQVPVDSYLLPGETFARQEGLLKALPVTGSGVLIVDVLPDSLAAQAGLKAQDRIVAMAQQPVTETRDINTINQQYADQPVAYDILRAGQPQTISLTPKSGEYIGLILDSNWEVAETRMPLYQAPVAAAAEVGKQVYVTVLLAGDVVKSIVQKFSVPKEVSGPVGIFEMTSAYAAAGIIPLMLFMAMISVSLAVMNILPFPALDGGRFLFLLAELITRRKLPSKVEGMIHMGGFILLILFILIVTKNDLFRLLGW